jgi:beta-galactosidase
MIPWGVNSQVFAPGKFVGGNAPPFAPGLRASYRKGVEKSQYYLDTDHGWIETPSSDALLEVNGPTLAWIAGAPENFYEKAHSFRPGQMVKKQVCLINDLPGDDAPYHVTWRVTVADKTLHEENADGKIAGATNLFLPVSFTLPAGIDGAKADGEIDLDATIGDRKSTDKFPFRIFAADSTSLPKVLIYDPAGKTSALLKSLGVDAAPWQSGDATSDRNVLVVGREAFVGNKAPFADMDKFAADGGHVLVMSQDLDWMRKQAGFRMNRQVSRRFFPVMKDNPVTSGLDADDLRDWAGAGTLLDPRPVYNLLSFIDYGWHWGNQGSLSCSAVETPHLSGWTPLLQGEFDLAYSPLMELAYGKGSVILCTLDLEDQAPVDPVADLLARRILRQAADWNPPTRRKTVFLGNDDDAKWLQSLGLAFDRADALPAPDGLAIVGAGATVTPDQVKAFAQQGGNVLVLPADAGQNAVGKTVANKDGFYGAVDFQSSNAGPLAGLSTSDLHFRTATSWPLLAQDASTQADGLLSVDTLGTGTIVSTQLDPRRLNADKLPYFRFTRWRQTRAVSQILTNLGGTFAADGNLFHPGSKAALYHADYNPHVWDGDDPGRYYRW